MYWLWVVGEEVVKVKILVVVMVQAVAVAVGFVIMRLFLLHHKITQ